MQIRLAPGGLDLTKLQQSMHVTPTAVMAILKLVHENRFKALEYRLENLILSNLC
jgi:hypothetical protein